MRRGLLCREILFNEVIQPHDFDELNVSGDCYLLLINIYFFDAAKFTRKYYFCSKKFLNTTCKQQETNQNQICRNFGLLYVVQQIDQLALQISRQVTFTVKNFKQSLSNPLF